VYLKPLVHYWGPVGQLNNFSCDPKSTYPVLSVLVLVAGQIQMGDNVYNENLVLSTLQDPEAKTTVVVDNRNKQ
jgi:hypothetical protein